MTIKIKPTPQLICQMLQQFNYNDVIISSRRVLCPFKHTALNHAQLARSPRVAVVKAVRSSIVSDKHNIMADKIRFVDCRVDELVPLACIARAQCPA
jgi:hypothetical protein